MTILQQLESDGYAIQADVMAACECERLAVDLDRLEKEIRRDQKQRSGISSAQVTIHNIHFRSPELFLDMIDLPAVMETVGRVLKEDFILSNFNASRSGPDGGASSYRLSCANA